MKKDWTYKKLGEVCEIQYGTRVVQSRDGGSIYPVYGGGGPTFKMDTYNREDCLVVARFAMSKQCTRYVKGKFFLNDSGLTLEPKDKESLLQSYLDKCILGLNDDIYFVAKGMAQKNLDMKSFKELPIKYPTSTSEQQQIVAELDLLGDVIEKQKAQIEELDKLAQSIFYNMFGDPVSNERGWEFKNLSDIASFKNGINYHADDNGASIKCIGVGDFKNNNEIRNFDDVKTIQIEDVIDDSYLLRDGDILIVRSNGSKDLVGRNMIVYTSGEEITYSGFCIRCRLDEKIIIPLFMNRILSDRNTMKILRQEGQGCNISNINQKILSSLSIVLPPLSLQQEFAAKIEAIEAMKAKVRQSLKESETLFNSRMDYYFN